MENMRIDKDDGNGDHWDAFRALRRKAKKVLDNLGVQGGLGEGLDHRQMLEELNVYHIELELQNEELLQTRDQLEASRKYLKDLFRFSPVGYMVLTHDGLIEDINEAASSYFELKRGVLIGNRLHAFIPHDHYVAFATSFTRVVEKNAVQRAEVRFRVKEDHQFWARLDLFQIFHPVEERPVVLCAMIDISKEKEAEKVLRNAKEHLASMVAEQTRELQKVNRLLMAEKEMLIESERRFKETADLLPTIICELDLQHRITYINEAGKSLLGVDPLDGTADLAIIRSLHEADRSRAEDYFREVLQGQKPEPREFRMRLPGDGGEAVFLAKAAAMRMNGVVVGSRLSLTDVTTLKHMQNRLYQAQKMESMATLAGGIAHEFNNALTTVLGNASLVEMSDPSPTARKYIDSLKDAGEHMAQLTKHLLAYARGGKYIIKQIDPNRLVTDILHIIRHNFANPFSIQTRLTTGLPMIKGDAAQLDMLLLALLTNASEASEDTQHVLVRTEFRSVEDRVAALRPGMRPGDYVVLTVQDEGCGMSQETLNKIFEPFYTTKFQGRGLGMAAAYGIVKNHNGWIGVESEPGKGTMVEVYLPVSSENAG